MAGSLIAAVVAGCARQDAVQPEPTGGEWRVRLLPSGAAIRLPAPPAANSDRQRAEVEELQTLQRQRTPQTDATVMFWDSGASVRWNEIARDLVAKHRTSPPMAARVYALLSVGQYDALVAAWNNKYFYKRAPPGKLDLSRALLTAEPVDPAYPSEHSTVAAVSAAILADLYPDEAGFLGTKLFEHQESRLWAGVSFRSDIAAGDALGRDVAKFVIEHAHSDNSDAIWAGKLPAGEGRWASAANDRPMLPLWGKVKPWLMSSGAQFRANPPPAYGSAGFNAALDDLRKIAATRTAEQARIAALWADGLGSYAPPGRWNKIAADLIQKHRLNEIRSARALALLNMVLMDASIACWETKYHYLVVRPPQADPSIPTPIGLPNFPSYPSAHATFSGAAAELLGHLFAGEAQVLLDKAREAAASREHGGIHYRFDGEAGLAQGRAIAQLGVDRGRSDGSP